MKINPDAIRSVLLYIEEKQTYTFDGINAELLCIYANSIIEDNQLLEKYTKEDLLYSIIILSQTKYIDAFVTNDKNFIIPNKTIIYDITWEGHEFLNTIRKDGFWNEVKKNAEKFGDMSVSGLKFVAKSMFQAIVTRPETIGEAIKFWFVK